MNQHLLHPALALTSYSPFGVGLEGRTYTSESGYRYGFNGKEKDEEGMGGGGQTYDYGFRIYNPNLGRFLSIDPLSSNYPSYSPFAYAINCPISLIDFKGMGPINPCPNAGNEEIEDSSQEAYNGGTSVWQAGGCYWIWMFNPWLSHTLNVGTLTESAKARDNQGQLDFTINAQQFEGTYYFDCTSQGLNIENRVTIEGRSSPGTFYMSMDNMGTWSFGAGDPPQNSSMAFGGGIPVVINGLAYGNGNLYSAGVPEGAPLIGPVPENCQQYLIQKNSNGYVKQNTTNVGKAIVGYNSNTRAFIVCVQENGVQGLTLDTIKSYYLSWGFNNVLAFDGSNTAMLVQDQQVLIDPADYKDSSVPCGITFTVSK
jgi:RHS repeat-associated protein